MNFTKQFLVLFSLLYIISCDTSTCPKKTSKKGVSKDNKNQIVKKHNEYRKQFRVYSKRTKNKTLKWDEDLAKMAQKIANSCIQQTINLNYVSHNLYMVQSTFESKAKWYAAIKRWFEEYKEIYQKDPAKEGVIDHSHDVLAEAVRVGCGYICYPQEKVKTSKKTRYSQLYICKYA